MVKKLPKQRPKWLKKGVTPTMQTVARTSVGSYIDTVWPKMKKCKTVLPLLHGFFDYLGTKDPAFKKVEPEDLATSDTTTSVLYNLLKKQWKLRKKRASQPKAKAETESEPGPEDPNTTWMKKHHPTKDADTPANGQEKPKLEEQKVENADDDDSDESSESSDEEMEEELDEDQFEEPAKPSEQPAKLPILGQSKFQVVKAKFL